MKCPECGSPSEVLKVRESGNGIWRRHRCLHYKHRFSSFQKIKAAKKKAKTKAA